MRGLMLFGPFLLFMAWLVFSSWRGNWRNQRQRCFNCGVALQTDAVIVNRRPQGKGNSNIKRITSISLCPPCARQRKLWAWGSALALLAIAIFIAFHFFKY